MANFGPLVAEIGSGVCGTPANFNGFRILAALLHGNLVGQRAPPIFGSAAITLGIGPHSSLHGYKTQRNRKDARCDIPISLVDVVSWKYEYRYRYKSISFTTSKLNSIACNFKA